MAFQTPTRPLPGAFFNTPAAGRNTSMRQPVFSSLGRTSGMVTGGQTAQSSPRPSQASQPIQRAARTINEYLQREASFPELDSYVRQGMSSDYEIPNTATETAWTPFQRMRVHEIPDRILEQYNRAEVSTAMGLFAELNHAWVTIDNALYLWDYTNPNPELIGYEEQTHNITAVNLVKPRKGVFVKDVNHLLVVATTQEIILLGLAATTQGSGVQTVALYATHMSLAIRGINVQVIEGSADTGRIFFSGGTNTEIYELTYQQEEKWFASRCGKINHTSPGYTAVVPTVWGKRSQESILQMVVDDSRRLLYTLSSESSIRTFHMDTPTTLAQVIEKKKQEILRDMSHMASSSPVLTPQMQIVSISSISANEAVKLHLMATTSTGCRLYLSATRGYGYISGQGAPQSMQVQHIKFPPSTNGGPSGGSQYASTGTPTDNSSTALVLTRKAIRLPPGIFLCFVSKQAEVGRDHLFLSGPDTGRIAAEARAITAEPKYYETGNWVPLNSHAEAIDLVTPRFAASKQPLGFGNELAVQFDDPPMEIAVLTNSGVHVLRRRRLVDIFAAAIRTGGGDEGLENEVKKFIRQYGRGETTATALAVACGQGNDAVAGDSRVARLSDPETLKLARKAFIEYGGRPLLNSDSVSESLGYAADNIIPSSRHEGLAMYMARLVRALWKTPVIRETQLKTGGAQIDSPVKSDKLTSIQEELSKLAAFLNDNKSFIEGLSGPEGLQNAANQQQARELQGEHQALHSLQKLNASIIEGISFVQMLFEERVNEIWKALDDNVKRGLRNLTFELLFATDQGRDLAKVLVKAIVNRNIANGSNVDTVADALRRRCGSFCSADDVIIFKAQEQLQKASEPGSSPEMVRNLLNESLRLFQQVAGSLSFENLQSAVAQFSTLQFYAGAISLALLAAHESDRGNTAQSWVNESQPADDPRKALLDFRLECYNLVHQILVDVDNAAGSQPDFVDGRATLIATKRIEAHTVVNDSEDELFQFNLYDWYLSQHWEDRLLAVDSPFVVHFLTQSATSSIERSDLLWKFYVHRDNFYEAGVVQLDLAKSEFLIPLAKRIEYLSRAKANASTQSPGIGRQARQVLLYEISELLDVANVQLELLERLGQDDRVPDARRPQIAQALDNQILNLTELFNEYADQANYFDICLEIYECADHRNEADISATWQQLLDHTHGKRNNEGGVQAAYEAVVNMIQEMANRLNHSESTFSPNIIIPMIEKYAVEFQANVANVYWVPDLFLEVNIPHETLIQILQSMWYNNVAPFAGRNRVVLANHIVHVCEHWYETCISTNTRLFGSDDNAQDISELLGVLSNNLSSDVQGKVDQLRRNIQRSFR
ncbi:putative nucleoporin [Amylocarpus encephaloides]|uniref:Nucleoporin n=1 Tax=Amylocarpus encephaloides TaxID=45428 RepID=A0A9P8C9X8_9HELO|nr:putative nucleoporin [Amylocarpus encephaloides]